MDKPSNYLVDRVADFLMHLCHEYGIFHSQTNDNNKMDDLIDTGLIDSMGFMYMQAMIHEKLTVELTPELFITELRDIQSIAVYVVNQLPVEQLENLMNTSEAP